MRLSRAIRPAAWGLIAAGLSASALRRRSRLPKGPALALAATVPAAVYVALPKTRLRGAAVCVAQMWTYLAAYELPNDYPAALRERVRVQYPITIDRALGLGRLPTERLQDAFSRRGRTTQFEKVLAWSHWSWFGFPHAAVAYVALRAPERFPAAAARMYAVFDLG
ncbi:MAG: phosphatase PAP2 family protein, partial [Solirubrobacteraceae bacterium]